MVKLLVTGPEIGNNGYEFFTGSDLSALREKTKIRGAIQGFIDKIEGITSGKQMDLFPEDVNGNKYVSVEVDDVTFSKLIHGNIEDVENFIARILILNNSDKKYPLPTLVESSKIPEQENLPNMFSLLEIKEAA